jgi:hypothetical protein
MIEILWIAVAVVALIGLVVVAILLNITKDREIEEDCAAYRNGLPKY